MLPGLWQVLVSLGVFASVRSLPRSVALGGAWYFLAGFATLLLASQNHALSPWTMGLPFVLGQLLMAAILHFASGETDVEDCSERRAVLLQRSRSSHSREGQARVV